MDSLGCLVSTTVITEFRAVELNMFYGATGRKLSMPEGEGTVWDRFAALGLELVGPQAPNGCDQHCRCSRMCRRILGNVPTYYTRQQKHATAANRQLDYVFASRGFH